MKGLQLTSGLTVSSSIETFALISTLHVNTSNLDSENGPVMMLQTRRCNSQGRQRWRSKVVIIILCSPVLCLSSHCDSGLNYTQAKPGHLCRSPHHEPSPPAQYLKPS